MGLNKFVAFSCMSLTLACAGVAEADSFSNGQFVTYNQTDWGSGGAAASLLSADYESVFASTGGVLFVGETNQPNVAFSGPQYVLTYLPASGTAAPLTTTYVNPSTTTAGIFAGDVVALDLNVVFNNAGLLGSTSSIPFGNLVLTDFTGSLSGLNGLTVSEFLMDVADPCLAGPTCPYGVQNVDDVTEELNLSFEAGTPDSWADAYLELPSSGTPTPTPEPSSLLLLAPALAGLAFLQRRRILRI